MLRSFDPDAGDEDVPDPYYGDYAGFVEVLGMVEAAMPGLVEWVRSRVDEGGRRGVAGPAGGRA